MGLGEPNSYKLSDLMSAVILLVLVTSSSLLAQPPRERDPFFQALREVHTQRSPDRELHETLFKFKDVSTAIGLAEEDREQIKNLVRESIRKTMDLRDELKDADIAGELIITRISEVQAPYDQQISELLHTANFDRLLGIYVQDKSERAVTNTAVAEKIGLPPKEMNELRSYRSKLWGSLMDENREEVRDLVRQGKREQIIALFRKAEEKLNKAMAAKLTQEQRAALEALKGEKFEFHEVERSGRPNGTAPGGRRNNEKECCKVEP